MSNNKQSSVDAIMKFMKENGYFIGNDLYQFFEKAKAMHKEEHHETWDECLLSSNPEKTFEDHYNETYANESNN